MSSDRLNCFKIRSFWVKICTLTEPAAFPSLPAQVPSEYGHRAPISLPITVWQCPSPLYQCPFTFSPILSALCTMITPIKCMVHEALLIGTHSNAGALLCATTCFSQKYWILPCFTSVSSLSCQSVCLNQSFIHQSIWNKSLKIKYFYYSILQRFRMVHSLGRFHSCFTLQSSLIGAFQLSVALDHGSSVAQLFDS